jgi:biotin carboxyl carrier protein
MSANTPPPEERRAARRSGGTGRESAQPTTAYTVELAGQSVIVSLTGDQVSIDGVEVAATIMAVPYSPIRVLRVGDAVYELIPLRGDHRGAYTITTVGETAAVEALDERAQAVRSLRAAAATVGGPEPVRAPMPGLVSRVLVAAGDVVKAGASLIVMEAMKMENELRAKTDGRVRAVPVQPGTPVEKGAILVEWEEQRPVVGSNRTAVVGSR